MYSARGGVKYSPRPWQYYYKSYYLPICRFIFRRTSRWHVAEEIAQDVFMRFYEKFDLLDDENLVGYIYVSAQNAIIDYYRANLDNEADTSYLHKPIRNDGESSELYELIADSYNYEPEHLSEVAESCRGLVEALKRLSKEERQVVVAALEHCGGGGSLRYASRVLGLPYLTVKGRNQRAMRKLKGFMNPNPSHA